MPDEHQLDAAIFDTVASLIVVLDRDGRVVKFNRACERLTGRSRQEAVGRFLWDFALPPEEIERAKSVFARMRAEGVPAEYQNEWLTPAGRRTIAWSSTALLDEAGRVRFVVGTGRDVTEQVRAQAAARDAERRLEFALSAANMVAWEWEPGSGRNFHRGSTDLLGAPQWPEEYFHVIHPEDAPTIKEMIERLLQRPGSFAAEYRIQDPDGKVRWVRDRGVMEATADGTPLRMAGVSFDVTERRKAEAELQKLNATLEQRVAQRTTELERQTRLLELVLENMGDGVAVADVSGRFLLFNAAMSRMLGRTPGQVIIERWPDYFGFFQADGVTPYPQEQLPLRRAIRGESVDDAELLVRKDHDGEAHWVSVTARPVRDNRGNLIGGVSVMRDLSERKSAEQALRLSETRLRLLIEQAPVSVQTFWPDGTIRSVNRAWEQLFGVTPADIPGYNILADPQLVERGIMPLIQRAFAGETLAIPPIPYVPDRGPHVGRQLWTRAHIYPVMDERRQIYEVVLIHEDISEQKRTEDELRESERHYRELSEHNRRLVQEVEHRVRNNLAALLGLISVMRAEATDVQSFADAIEARIGGMAHVHQMLATSGWQPVELRTLIDSMLHALQHAACEGVVQVIEGPDVVVSPRRVLPLAMILVEWFTNSCKYGAHSVPGGKLTVGWSLLPGGAVRLAWKERGGPPVTQPPRASLGTELVNAFATRELSGNCTSRFDSDGVCHLLEFSPVQNS